VLLEVRDVFANAALHGKNDEFLVSKRIDNAIIALADPIEMVQTLELGDTGRAWICAECIDPFHENLPKWFG
jgi:hypothetical protein